MRVKRLEHITFSEIMNFYPEHNRSVYEELTYACQRGHVIPFVGAGLSVFCGYQVWPDVLKRLAAYVYSPDVKTQIEAAIEKGELMQAAQSIQDHYPRMLRELRKIIRYDKIKACPDSKLYASAAYVLPYLFCDGFVMTTNFDRVLEEIYEKRHVKFGNVLTPYKPDLLTQSRQNNPHCLFKLHGDIGPEVFDIEQLVFTQKQYDRAYAAGGPLIQELSQWFQNKMLLFLGCSLAKDRTMDVLQQATSRNPGLEHFAILECCPEDLPQRCIEMGDLGISAIYYPDGRHEAVRVILERLLEDVNHDAYEELKRSSPVSVPQASRRFMYNSGYISFVGRKQELARLEEFCQTTAPVSWWAISGPGGMGKSRLIYEFTNTKQADGWKVFWLKHTDYDSLAHWFPPSDPCILVADDVQAHLQTLGKWMLSISSRMRSEKLRMILLERDGENLNSAKWAELLCSDSPYEDTLSDICYCSDFLHLDPLSDDELKAIMADFAQASDRPLADGEHAERLLQALKKIDSGFQRPIYAMAIADAWCSGKDPACWNKGQVLDALVVRELKFYHDRLRNLSKQISKELRAELEYLLARSCIGPFLPLNQIADNDYPKLRKKAEQLDISFSELLRQIGAAHQVEIRVYINKGISDQSIAKKDMLEVVLLDCPDLLKEHLVLQQAFDRKQISLLFPEDWDNDPGQMFFLGRLLVDYPESLEEQELFCTKFFAAAPTTEFFAEIYGNLLFAAMSQSHKMEHQAFTRLEQLHEQFNANEDIAFEYGKGLVNLSADQGLEKCIITVGKLEALYEQFPKNEGFTAMLMFGLGNLSQNQGLEDRAITADKLSALYEQFPENEELAIVYANGLLDLLTDQILEDCIISVGKLESLYTRFQSSEELAITYAQAVFRLTVKRDLEDCAVSVDKLRMLYEQFPENETLASSYARGLVNLTAKQAPEEIVFSVDKLRMFYERKPQNAEFAVIYAKGLFNLALGEKSKDCSGNIDKLERIYEQFPENEELASVYALGLISLTDHNTLSECMICAAKVQLLYERFPESEELALFLMQSMINLTFYQDKEDDTKESMKQAEKLLKKYPTNTGMQMAYGKMMFNLSLKQSSGALQETIARLCDILSAYPDMNQEFQTALDEYLSEHPEHTERYLPLRTCIHS